MALTQEQKDKKSNLITTALLSGFGAVASLAFIGGPVGLAVACILGLVSLFSAAQAASVGASPSITSTSHSHSHVGVAVGVGFKPKHGVKFAPGHTVLHEVHHAKPHHSHVHVPGGSKPAKPVAPSFKAHKSATSGFGFGSTSSSDFSSRRSAAASTSGFSSGIRFTRKMPK